MASQDKIRKRLETICRKEENRSCADCGSREPRWASANLGAFICLACSGIHRNLGVHISFVRSVNLDTWKEEQVARMAELGNAHAKAVYEANVPAGYKRPHEQSTVREMEKWIRDKYEHKRFVVKTCNKKSLENPRKIDDKMVSPSSTRGGASKRSRNSSRTREKYVPSGTISSPKEIAVMQHERDKKAVVVEDLLSFAHDDVISTDASLLQQTGGKNVQHVHNVSAFQPGYTSLPVSPVPSNRLKGSQLPQYPSQYNVVPHNVSDFGEFQSALGQQQQRPRSLPTNHNSGSNPKAKLNNVLQTDAILSMFNEPQYNAASDINMAPGGMQMGGYEAKFRQHQMHPVQSPGLTTGNNAREPVGIPGQALPPMTRSPLGGLGKGGNMDQNRVMPDPTMCNPQVLQYLRTSPGNVQGVEACGQKGPPPATSQMHEKDYFANLF